MAGPNLSDYTDLVKSTRKARPMGKWSNALTDLQSFPGFTRLYKGTQPIDMISSYSFEWDIQFDTAGNARSSSELESDTTAQTPTAQTASVDLRHQQTSWSVTEGQLAANGAGSRNASDGQRLWNFMQTERGKGWYDLAERIETDFWTYPATTDNYTPYGLLYPINFTASASGGFVGGAPGSHTDIYGLSPTTYSRHNCWCQTYTDVTRDDLIDAMNLGAYKTKFMAPVKVPEIAVLGQNVFYTNYSVNNDLRHKLEDRNENLGTDLAIYNNQAHIKSAPIITVPKLDANTSNPVIQVNWSVTRVKMLKGFKFKETEPKVSGNKHLVIETFVDIYWAIACEDLRANAIYQTS